MFSMREEINYRKSRGREMYVYCGNKREIEVFTQTLDEMGVKNRTYDEVSNRELFKGMSKGMFLFKPFYYEVRLRDESLRKNPLGNTIYEMSEAEEIKRLTEHTRAAMYAANEAPWLRERLAKEAAEKEDRDRAYERELRVKSARKARGEED